MKSIHLFLSDFSFSQTSTMISFSDWFIPLHLLLYLSFIITFFYLFFFEMSRVFAVEILVSVSLPETETKYEIFTCNWRGTVPLRTTNRINSMQFPKTFSLNGININYSKCLSLKMSNTEINAYEVFFFITVS